ncbi:CST complex subunit CTC1-like, partial [Saccoglossus kowalevskii]
FLIDDGTYEANVFCNGDVVAMILGLSKTQCSSIHEVVYQTGEVSYTYQSNEYYNSTSHNVHWGMNPLESLLQSLCTSQMSCRPVVLFCKQFRPNSEMNHNNRNYPLRSFGYGHNRYQTKVLPRVHLFCVAMKEVFY